MLRRRGVMPSLGNAFWQHTDVWIHFQIQQLQREGDAIKVHADTLAESLDRVLASREQALRCAKVAP